MQEEIKTKQPELVMDAEASHIEDAEASNIEDAQASKSVSCAPEVNMLTAQAMTTALTDDKKIIPVAPTPPRFEFLFLRRFFAWLLDIFIVSGIVAVFVVIFSIGSALSTRSGMASFVELFTDSILPNFGLVFAFVICWCLSFLNTMAPAFTVIVLKLWWPFVPMDYEANAFLIQRTLFVSSCLIQCAYSGYFLSRPFAATPGKLLMGLKTTDELGNPLSFWAGAWREFWRALYLPYLINWLRRPSLKSPQICNTDVVSTTSSTVKHKSPFYHPYFATSAVLTIILAVLYQLLR